MASQNMMSREISSMPTGLGIVEESGIYYLFGEYKSDKSNAFNGFSCYSSRDLAHWKFERIVLGVQKSGILGPTA